MESNKVLFVDDELSILNAIKRSMIEEDIESLIAISGEKALELIKENEVKVIVTDMKMPKMNGLDLLEKIQEINLDCDSALIVKIRLKDIKVDNSGENKIFFELVLSIIKNYLSMIDGSMEIDIEKKIITIKENTKDSLLMKRGDIDV